MPFAVVFITVLQSSQWDSYPGGDQATGGCLSEWEKIKIGIIQMSSNPFWITCNLCNLGVVI